MRPLTFIIIGSGWRSLFYVRIAKRFPELFQLKYMFCRTQEKADKMASEHGIETTISEEVCEKAKPEFVVVAVAKNSIFKETKKWAEKGFPVLCETPAGSNLDELKMLWDLAQKGAKIQVAEQYCRYPIMAAGLTSLKEGKVSDPYSVTLSAAHDYHGVSLIRHMLQPEKPMDLKVEYVCGTCYTFPITETNSRQGAICDGRMKESERVRITIQFANQKVAFYDFDKIQYHSYIRGRYLNVQGLRGEWNDTILRYVNAKNVPVLEEVTFLLEPKYNSLLTNELKKHSETWNPFLEMGDEQDEYAIATMMLDMRKYLKDGVEVYPLKEALEDAYLWLLFQEAMKHPNEKIIPEQMPWQ